ncbi:heme-copper oxidase subunit III [Sphingomonas ginkgonis]|uniref:Heme-copper oxidase subunit III n=1 Tax=Sphingomonas ginkgonis TaxID=2315330 RepID=A0A3R9Y6I8_9SPHN|nr:cytochrome c oxidase subunit 3 [Sphingomonas ginkgonis]RST31240.1 heme-copper oxidase subunit III [Sphingomonas ginkgonis]
MAELAETRPAALPVGPTGSEGVGRSGMLALIATEGALFGYLLFSYYYNGGSGGPNWVAEARPDLRLALPNTILLLLSSLVIWRAEKATRLGDRRTALLGSGLTLLMGTVFAVVQWFEWKAKSYGIGASSAASLYYVTTGFHMAHVVVGLIVLALLFLWTWLGYFSPVRRIVFTNGALYWHFVDGVWLFVFTTYYLTPYLGFGR